MSNRAGRPLVVRAVRWTCACSATNHEDFPCWRCDAHPPAHVTDAVPDPLLLGGSDATPAPSGETRFDLHLLDGGPNKVSAVMSVRDLLGTDLAKAKSLVDAAPIILRLGVPGLRAEELRRALVAAGARCVLLAATGERTTPT